MIKRFFKKAKNFIHDMWVGEFGDEEFGVVMWNDEDLCNALQEYGMEPTEEAVETLRSILIEDRHFEEAMIARGWDYIQDTICANRSELNG